MFHQTMSGLWKIMMETMKVWMGMLQSAEDVGDPPNMENLDDEGNGLDDDQMEDEFSN